MSNFPCNFPLKVNRYVDHNSEMDRSSRPEVFCNKAVLRNFAKFIGKHLCQSLFFNKAASVRPATLLKRRQWYRCFPVDFTKFLRTSFLTDHLQLLLLDGRYFKVVSKKIKYRSSSSHRRKLNSQNWNKLLVWLNISTWKHEAPWWKYIER